MRTLRTIEWTTRAGAVILTVGAVALSMVLMRHARLQAAHELTQSRRRTVELERQLRRVRARLAEHRLPAGDTAAPPEFETAGPDAADPSGLFAREGRAE